MLCAVCCAVKEEAVLETRPVKVDVSDSELLQLKRALAERSEELLGSGGGQQAEPPDGHGDTGENAGSDGGGGGYEGKGKDRLRAHGGGDKAAARDAAAIAVSAREAELEAADRRAAQTEKDVRVVEDVRRVAALKRT